MEGIKIEIGERERRGGDDVSRNVSPPTTTGDEVDYGVAHTRSTRHEREIESEIFSHCVQREEGRKENLPSDRRAHYSSMTKWRWKKREKEEIGRWTHVRTTCSPTYLPSPLEEEEEEKDGRPDRFTDSYRLFLYQKEEKFLFSSL
jgi:hypothetical protein